MSNFEERLIKSLKIKQTNKDLIMKKLLIAFMAMGTIFALTGCGEKTNEEKAADAVEEAKEAGNKAADDAKDALNKLGK